MPARRHPVSTRRRPDRLSSGLRSAVAPPRSGEEMEIESDGVTLPEHRLQDETPVLTNTEAILRNLREYFEISDSADVENRRQAKIDDRFKNLDQWDHEVKAAREARDEPCLVIDHINAPILQLGNQHRDSRPAIKVSPKGGGATKKVAQKIQGIIRQIEYDSYAPAVYSWAFDQAVSSGRGYWRVNVEFASDSNNDQELKVHRILNKFSVYRDPTAIMPDRSDARWWILTDDIPLSEYRERYKGSRVAVSFGTASFESLMGSGDTGKGWLSEETVRVAEFWFKRKKTRRLIATGPEQFQMTDDLSDATLGPPDGQTEPVNYLPGADGGRGLPILFHRDIDSEQVMWCKCNAVEILEGNADLTDAREWNGKYIPIVEMVGEEVLVEDQMFYRGITRRMRDAQVMLNTEASDMVLTQLRAPKHVWSGYVGQFGSSSNDPVWQQWMNAHRARLPFVQAVPIEHKGVILPPPQLNQAEVPIQHMVLGVNLASQFIRDTSGFHQASLGDLSPQERSGKAIAQLQRAQEQGTSHYSFNFGIALQYTGRILVDLIPLIYNRPGRLVRLLGEDNEEDAILIERPFRETPDGPVPISPDQFRVGQDHVISLREGVYGVTVTPGRSYATRREETNEALSAIAKAAPQLVPTIAPAWVETLDFAGSDDLAEQLQNALPPHLRKRKPGEVQIPPEVQQQMDAAQKVIDALTEQVNSLQDQIDAKLLDVSSRERIAGLNNMVKLEIARLQAANQQIQQARQMADQRAQTEMGMAAQFAQQFVTNAHDRTMQSDAARNAMAQQQMAAQTEGGGGGGGV